MVQIYTIENFDREFKRLAKKYASLKSDLKVLIEKLQEEPAHGISLGSNTYKIRLAIASKNRGESGGARVITYFVNQDNEVFLLSIYDKSERADIPDSVLQELIQEVLASK